MAENLVLVDSQNTVMGTAPKDACHDGDGMLHRAFSVFVFNDEQKLLLQQRAAEKRLWPGYWSNSCCGHQRLHESVLSAVKRKLRQELGITGYRISELYRFEYRASYLNVGSENELCSVVVCRTRDPLAVNPREAAATRWISLPDLEAEMDNQPDQFTPWFKLEIDHLASNFIQQIHAMYP